MNLKIHDLTEHVVGKYLGVNLFSSKGTLLLRKGSEITQTHFKHMKHTGYRSVYTQENDDSYFNSNGLIISENMRAKAPQIINKIFADLLSDKRDVLVRARNELKQLAEKLLNEVNYRVDAGHVFLDLKRDSDYFYQHSLNVALYSILVGHSMHFHQLKLLDLTLASLLHDFGKSFVDEAVIYKTTPLDENEKEQWKEHTIKGFQYLGRACQMNGPITIVALQHHEHFDGSGHPNKLTGAEMHEYSRIVAVTTFFDTLTSDRPYRTLRTIEETLRQIQSQREELFDPDVVDHFVKLFEY